MGGGPPSPDIFSFCEGQAVLGPLPPGWTLQYDLVGGYRIAKEFKRYPLLPGDEGKRLADPRLPDVDRKWNWLEKRWDRDDVEMGERWQNRVSGEVVDYHPAMTVDALRGRGVWLETFVLV